MVGGGHIYDWHLTHRRTTYAALARPQAKTTGVAAAPSFLLIAKSSPDAHSSKESARIRNALGMVRPSVRATRRLTTSSN